MSETAAGISCLPLKVNFIRSVFTLARFEVWTSVCSVTLCPNDVRPDCTTSVKTRETTAALRTNLDKILPVKYELQSVNIW